MEYKYRHYIFSPVATKKKIIIEQAAIYNYTFYDPFLVHHFDELPFTFVVYFFLSYYEFLNEKPKKSEISGSFYKAFTARKKMRAMFRFFLHIFLYKSTNNRFFDDFDAFL